MQDAYSTIGYRSAITIGYHLPYGITQCYLPRNTSESAPPIPQPCRHTRFTYPREMEGWVNLVDLIAPWPGVQQATFRSPVRRPATAPSRQPVYSTILNQLATVTVAGVTSCIRETPVQ